jgi:beta-glucosidase-like glycosyl hydrolase
MSLDDKIGRLFSVPARGTELTAELVRQVRENRVGGVIWFQSTSAAAAEITRRLQEMSAEPLLVSADFESGVGMRFTDSLWWPPAMAVAAAGDLSLAEEQARATAREALSLGIPHVLAPVADVNVDPENPVINTRSFGEDPAEVARFVAATVRGIESEGAIACAKHFPGHGDTHVDSHRALPSLDVTRDRLDEVELVPFRAAIEAGVRSVMIGHLSVPALDDSIAPVRETFENVWGTDAAEVPHGATMPATVSRAIVTDLLRRDLGFDGLVVSDAFDMGGLAAHFDPGEAAVRAIEAGLDQILYSSDTDAAIAAVRSAVLSGRLTESRIEESVERLRRVRGHVRAGVPHRDPAQDLAVASEIAERSIRIVRDDGGLLPLPQQHTPFIVTDLPETNPLGELEAERVIDATTEPFDIEPGVLVLYLALRPRSGAGRIALPEAARRLAEKHARHTIAVSFGSPYIERALGAVSTFVCAWGIQPVMQRAAMRLLKKSAR